MSFFSQKMNPVAYPERTGPCAQYMFVFSRPNHYQMRVVREMFHCLNQKLQTIFFDQTRNTRHKKRIVGEKEFFSYLFFHALPSCRIRTNKCLHRNSVGYDCSIRPGKPHSFSPLHKKMTDRLKTVGELKNLPVPSFERAAALFHVLRRVAFLKDRKSTR